MKNNTDTKVQQKKHQNYGSIITNRMQQKKDKLTKEKEEDYRKSMKIKELL